MTLSKCLLATALAFASIGSAFAGQNDTRMIEIYHIAPGKHVEFLKLIAQYDEANRQAGLPPRELYVHSDGGAWDFLLIQNETVDPAKQALVDAALKKLGAPTGAKFWVAIRQTIADHTDTVATGPTTAGDWLKKLEN
ncbi:MAG: hypothetical protein J0I77_11075 [Rudaea sp.]|uniref:hypothetical protein n=1 Tax=unclassified Rudaea TaxID=2627037 RepID=UPI0010F96BF6|nr:MULTISPECIES: hypothetical protein [unclassified Rudaea]MBN8886255.1 hypothetical protein [Rudaea sp.]MBR0345125.1 hypothetical protein [Rudaea sp.]